MKAVVFHGVGDIRMDDVDEPAIQDSTDAIVRITTSAICGTDLHIVRGTMPGMQEGTILGHEAVGIVEEAGSGVRNFRRGDRVVIPSTIGCGYCSYCRDGYFAQCDIANPNGAQAGTCFFGGPAQTGPIHGLQSEYARVPYAYTNLVRIPEHVKDEEAILVSDIFPTGFFGAELAEVSHGDTVAVFGCGPVGLFAIASAFYQGATRLIAIDREPTRLEVAQALGAEAINFDEFDPVQAIRDLTGGIGVDRVIDAVGVDAEPAAKGPAQAASQQHEEEYRDELQKIAPKTNPHGDQWRPGQAPTQALRWGVDAVAKAGTIGIIGVYPQTADNFPIGLAMNKNLTIHAGNCNHRKYVPKLLALIGSRTVDLDLILSNTEPMTSALEAYKAFDTRRPGWIKTALTIDEASLAAS